MNKPKFNGRTNQFLVDFFYQKTSIKNNKELIKHLKTEIDPLYQSNKNRKKHKPSAIKKIIKHFVVIGYLTEENGELSWNAGYIPLHRKEQEKKAKMTAKNIFSRF